MSKWIAEFDLEDGDTMPEHMDLEYKGANIDFHCRPMWIPVSERLPEPDVEVLVTDDAGGLATISTDSIYESEVTGEKEWYTSQNVTAWMSLPQPYREVEA